MVEIWICVGTLWINSYEELLDAHSRRTIHTEGTEFLDIVYSQCTMKC